MRARLIVVGVIALLGVAAASVGVSADEWLYSEASLNIGEYYSLTNVREVNVDSNGYVYLSESGTGSIWRINSLTDEFVTFDTWYPVTDAKPDRKGNIWWTDQNYTFGRVDPITRGISLWTIDQLDDFLLWGLAIDEYGRIWMPTWYRNAQINDPGYLKLHRFDPNHSELCTYTIPGGNEGRYILYRKPYVWFSASDLITQESWIYRFNSSDGNLEAWLIGSDQAYPVGIAFDRFGNLWWANPELHRLVRFEPSLGRMTSYYLPAAYAGLPQMVAVRDDQIWYTESSYGSIGILNPLSVPQDVLGYEYPLYSTPSPAGPSCRAVSPPIIGNAGGYYGPVPITWDPEKVLYMPNFDDSIWQIFKLTDDNGTSTPSPYGIASLGDGIWTVDTDRQKMMRFEPIYPHPPQYTYLSMVMR